MVWGGWCETACGSLGQTQHVCSYTEENVGGVPLSLTFLQEQGGWVWPVDEGEADRATAAVAAELAKSN